jgi:toxin ParE1/3/4
MPKPVIPRKRARRDVDEAIAFYLTEAGDGTALGFVTALERAYRHIAQHPASGSPRFAHELDVPGLRSWPVRRFPFVVFNVERPDHIDVWRVLHAARDIPSWMTEPDDR